MPKTHCLSQTQPAEMLCLDHSHTTTVVNHEIVESLNRGFLNTQFCHSAGSPNWLRVGGPCCQWPLLAVTSQCGPNCYCKPVNNDADPSYHSSGLFCCVTETGRVSKVDQSGRLLLSSPIDP